MAATSSAVSLIAGQSVRFVMRERTVALLSALFVVLVLISAWLGWQATATVNRVFVDASAFLKSAGQPVPTNPVLDTSPLALMRNMSVYVALIGALSAIVVGNRLVALDRRAGVLPLIGIRPIGPSAYACGKIVALFGVVGFLSLVGALIATATFLVLPAVALSTAQWAQLAGFMAVSALYMIVWGLIGLGVGAAARSESVGLLAPVTLWLTMTFVFPQLTSNLNPTAAINPISALAIPPDTPFFNWAAQILGPVSLADAYKFASATLLDYLPQGVASPAAVPPVMTLMLSAAVAAGFSLRALSRLSMAHGDYDV